MEFLTSNNRVVLIDDQDYQFICQYRWTAYRLGRNNEYAMTNIRGKKIYMHRVLMNAPQEIEVDHKNGNGLDNRRRENLRLATHMQNTANQRLSAANTSGYTGVTLMKSKIGQKKPWMAQAKHKGKHVLFGYFETAELAAEARKIGFAKIHGEFAPQHSR